MLQDLSDSLWRVDEGDDFQPATAVGADQGVDLVHFLNQPGPAAAAFRAEVLALGILAPAIDQAGSGIGAIPGSPLAAPAPRAALEYQPK